MSMLIQKKSGNLSSFETGKRIIDTVSVEWYETGKRILHKQTLSGQEIIIKFMGENQNLAQDDILYYDDERVIVIDILPCEVMIIRPVDIFQVASVCYEIGNRHLPLFISNDEILLAFERPLFHLLCASGFNVERGYRKLNNPLKTTVAAHSGKGNQGTLFSKIMKLSSLS
jgi:urease accessory protein